jgi:hypothetical protein
MLGVAQTAQRAGWGGDLPINIAIASTSAIGYEVYQEPGYSLNIGMAAVKDNEVDLTGYTSLTGYAHGKFTMAFNFRPDYTNESYSTGEYLGNIGRFQVLDYSNIGVLPDGWFCYCVANTGYEDPVNLAFGYGTPGWNLTANMPGSYLDWQQKWLYIVISVSTTEDDFTDWNAPNWSEGSLYIRITVYDQETGELYFRQDRKGDDAEMPNVANLANPLLCGDPYNTTTDLFDIRMFTSGSVSLMDQTISNFWCSYGTMFDPFSIDQATVAWRTNRPSKQIGNAVAWANLPFTDVVQTGTTPNERYWVKLSGDDLLSGADDKGLGRSEINGWFEEDAFNASNVWDDIRSTLIPKDRNT